jgi:hypothetical protein
MRVDDDDRQVAEGELMRLNGRMAALMDEIGDLEALDSPESYQERRLAEAKIEEGNIAREIDVVEDRI